ncbi:hypothetical protein DFJ74DRAFT_648233 [Hyaloraphidium curvatum]|nr:hypothetical protein DFJ74DRAFT_648233 [Hyaloraphidium curvatum]
MYRVGTARVSLSSSLRGAVDPLLPVRTAQQVNTRQVHSNTGLGQPRIPLNLACRPASGLKMRTAVITGANSGVGFGLVQLLLRHPIPADSPLAPRAEPHPAFADADPAPWRVVMVCRDAKRGEAARDDLWAAYQLECRVRQKAGQEVQPEELWSGPAGTRISLELADLADTDSVVALCRRLLARGEPIDRLVCNAGIMPCSGVSFLNLTNLVLAPRWTFETGGRIMVEEKGLRTGDKYDLGTIFAANVFGHYIMARMLAPLLRKSPSPLILWTGSTSARPAALDLLDPQAASAEFPYAASKRLLDLVSVYLSRREGGVKSVVCSPGNLPSNILRGALGRWMYDYGYVPSWYLTKWLGAAGNHTSAHTSASSLYLACVSPPSRFDPAVKYHSATTARDRWFVEELPIPAGEEEVERAGAYVEGLYGEVVGET